MVGQRLIAAQIAKNHVDRDFLSNRHHLEVHARTDALFRVRHGRAQLCALFVRKAFLDLRHNVGRQVVDKVGDLVGIERFDRVDELAAVHCVNQGLTNALIDFKKNVAVGVAANLVPNGQALVERQGLEHPGNVGRVQRFEDFLEEVCRRRRYRQRFVVLVGIVNGAVFCALFVLIKNLLDARKRTARLIGVERKRRSIRLFDGRLCRVTLFLFVIARAGGHRRLLPFRRRFLSSTQNRNGKTDRSVPTRCRREANTSVARNRTL